QNKRARRGRLPERVSTTRQGCCAPCPPRTVNRGLSARTVSAPTRIAFTRARSPCACRRAEMSVIQRGSPGGRVNRPSRDIPHFAMTNGRWVTIHLLKASLRRVHSLAKTLCRILTPAFRNCAMPLPEWRGLTSTAPTTTFLTPALRIASVHGAVRPTVEQGSRVTYSV